jgi:hypothetical protein
LEVENGLEKRHGRFSSFVSRSLGSRRLYLWLALLAVVLTLPSLGVGLLVDDYHHKLLMSDFDGIARLLDSPLDMFRFFDGDPERTAELMDYGIFPWWTYERIKGAFWRPLASITHWLDYVLWPDSPVLMHAQSILWYAGLVIAVTFLYRRLMSPAWIAGLAAVLFAVDDAHGMPVGFLANRNALMACLFGVLSLIAHDHWRREQRRAGMVLGPVLLAVSLLSAEAGIATCAYLGAYVLFMDRATWQRRIASLLPYVVVVLVWRILWACLGYGVENIGGYVDPLAEPGRFVSAAVNHAPFLLFAQWAGPASDISNFLFPRPLLVLWSAAIAFLVLLLVVLAPLLRCDRTARFWAAGMILSVVPICATFPSDRLLLFVSIGAMGLLAQFLALVFCNMPFRLTGLVRRVPALLVVLLLVLRHVLLAPLLLPLRAHPSMRPTESAHQVQIDGPLDDAVRGQDLVVVNPPAAFFALASVLEWAAEEEPMPRHVRVLTSSLLGSVEVRRAGEKTLVVRPEYGYIAWILDGLFRSQKHPLSLGDTVELTGMTVEVTKLTGDGQPAEAAFTFSVPLEDASLRWLQHKDGRFVPFAPPAVGETVVLEGQDLFPN